MLEALERVIQTVFRAHCKTPNDEFLSDLRVTFRGARSLLCALDGGQGDVQGSSPVILNRAELEAGQQLLLHSRW